MAKSFPTLVLVVGFSGTTSGDKEVQQVKKFIQEDKIQGVILFDYNIENPRQLKELTTYLKDGADKLLVTVDQEGGLVQRLRKKNSFTDYATPQFVAKTLDYEGAKQLYRKMASELNYFGINYNFAPCIDINPKHVPLSPIIGSLKRSYGTEENVALYAKAFIKAHEEEGVGTCLKHFPGHGSAQGDTHDGFVDTSKVWKKEEMNVFKTLIQDTSVEGVMTAHISHDDWGHEPATFSKSLINKLRKDYNFTGTIFCDDLHMGAILKKYSFKEALEKTYNAEVNGFIYSFNTKTMGRQSFHTLIDLVEEFWKLIKKFKNKR